MPIYPRGYLMTSDLDARLNDLDQHFKEASSDDFTNQLPEPGEYATVFRDVDTFESKGSDKTPAGVLFLKHTYEITLGDEAGRTIDFIYNLEPHKVLGAIPASEEELQQKLSFLKRDMKKLGFPVDDEDFSLSDLLPHNGGYDDKFGTPCLIAVRDSKKVNPQTNKPYRNAYLQQTMGEPLPSDIPDPTSDFSNPEQPSKEPAGGVPDDDDIPF